MKQVIFVGSTSYSGSTFLDFTLAHDAAGFSCGEVMAFFFPTKPHHVNPNCTAFPGCGCPRNNCRVWQKLKTRGPQYLYQAIFDRFPHVNFIVDSSKDPFWIAEQNETLANTNITVKNIALWKTPLEIATSFSKRKQESKWERAWTNYYRNYATLLGENWRSVRYEDFVKDPATLAQLCRVLDIPNFPGKEQYWKKSPYHALFGNHSARIHLNEDIENYTGHEQEKNEVTADSSHRSIYYRKTLDDQLAERVDKRIEKSKYVQPICKLLEARDIHNESAAPATIDAPIRRTTASILTRKYKRIAVNTAYRFAM